MGLGHFQGGRFNLILSVRHNADANRLDEWRASFEQASRLMFEATDGQHQFGTLTVCNNTTAGNLADVWMEDSSGRSSSAHLGLGQLGLHSQLMGDERFKPFIILHELGHLLYDLFDEYSGDDGDAECVGGSTANACIMEGGANDGDRFGNNGNGGALVIGRIRRFCVPANHDPDGDTRQDQRRGHSCWTSMGEQFTDLNVPAGLPAGADQADAGAITWNILASDPRFALVIDCSGSMQGNKLAQAKLGAMWWIDDARTGDSLAIVSYASTAASASPLESIQSEADRSSCRDAIDGLAAGGATSIGSGLRRGLEELLSPGGRTSAQAMVLLSDGLHNTGESPASVLPDALANLVRVFTIGIGNDIDSGLLQDIADLTGGEFRRIDPTLAAEEQEFQIRSALEQFSALARDGGGVAGASNERIAQEREAERATIVEPRASLATFLVSWRNPKDSLVIEVVSPSGRLIKQSSADPDVRVIAPRNRPYRAIQVNAPEPGRWLLRIGNRTRDRSVSLQRWAFVFSPLLEGALSVTPRRIDERGRIQARLAVSYGLLLAGLTIKAIVLGPGRFKKPLRFVAGKESHETDGYYTASLRGPFKPGVYTVEAWVSSSKSKTRFAHRERESAPEGLGSIPPFERRYTATFKVGEDSRD